VIIPRTLTGRGFLAACGLWTRARRKAFSTLAAGAFAEFGPGSTLQPPIRLNGTASIAVGSNVFVGAGCWLQAIGDPSQVAMTIGDGSEFAGNCTVSAAVSVTIGKRVLLARNVYISDHSHAFEDSGQAVLDQGITRQSAVTIGDGAWLGQNVVVGPGVHIGAGAVIGANAVVLADIPDHAVAAGVPARILRRLAVQEEPGG
jgi:acetyltransferase-like isoleucine patch superfamily enzyme